jgi:2-polyprenyl-3-methyl-5-hydroxy-6-metoxy-1,4-benzoquinol methylase
MLDAYVTQSLAHLRNIEEHLATLVSILSDGRGIPAKAEPFLAIPKEITPPIVPTEPTEKDEPVVPKVEHTVVHVETPAPKVEAVQTQSILVPVANETKSYAESFNDLKELLETEAWPLAVDPDLICHDESDDDKELRAEGIIEFLIDEDLEGKRFLDFGCGEGHVVRKALEKKPLVSRGYDLNKSESWATLEFPSGENHGVSESWQDIVANGPYDVVLLYDVLDHLEGDQVAELKRIRSVMAPGGRIYVRCHPFCSRHATHLYKKINKAFVHLIFSDVELARLGYGSGVKTHKIIHPHLVYKQWFNDSGLDLINENAIQENLEEFFHLNPIINERIKDNWKGTSIDPQLAAGKGFPSYQMRIQFVDYLLKTS